VSSRGAGLASVLSGFAFSLRAWYVWTHLGVQDVKNRYKRSIVGPVWLALSMGIMVVGLGILFGRIFERSASSYVAFLAVGMTVWGLLSSSISDGGYAFIAAESYIKQIPFPKQVYILRTMVVNLIVFTFGLPVLALALLYYRVPLSWASWWALPGLCLLVVCCLGQITLMSYLSVSFRDLPHATNSLLQLLYFFTPIIYPVDTLKARHLEVVLLLNPFYYLLEIVRFPILNAARPPIRLFLGAGAYTALVWAVALAVAAALDRKVAYRL